MAAGYDCMADGERHGARWLLTSLDPPATFTSCDEHFPLMMIPVVAHNLDTDADALYDVIRKYLDREIAKAAKAAKAGEVVVPPNGPEQQPTPGPGNGETAPELANSPTSSDTATTSSDSVPS